LIFVDNQGIIDPHLNLALEEHLLRHVDLGDDLLLFYINEPAIIIGRNQNTLEEINRDYVEAHGIHVVRRLSGGGAVYHDLGNLNFSFLTRNARENFQNFKKFTAPVIAVLNQLGVPAELGGRNDILVEGRKISGNAQYLSGDRMVSHGTLLYDSDLSNVAEALNVRLSKITSKGIKSVRSRVANIREFMPQALEIGDFKQRLLEGILQMDGSLPQYRLTGVDWQAIHQLADERYHTWEWNYGRSPAFNIQKTERFASGEIDARIDVHQGLIRQISFFGDFLGIGDVGELECLLVGVRYERNSLQDALAGVDLVGFFGDVSLDAFLAFLY
jgi:lipoate---protein ligase